MSTFTPPFPDRVDVDEVAFVPLTPSLLAQDYAAVMRDIPMLRVWSAQDWPTAEFTDTENLADLERHDREQGDGIALTYSVVLKGVVQGCVYVRPIADSLLTREVSLTEPLPVPLADVVVRGWVHDITPARLIEVTARFLSTFAFRRLWWQANTDTSDQLAACDELGWTDELRFVGATATWVLRSVPE